jgi:hypothetical protein
MMAMSDKIKEIHPLVEKALSLAHEGLDPIEFDDYAVEQIHNMIKQHFGKPDLKKTIVDLINLAAVLEERGCHSASLKLIIAVSIAGDFFKQNSKAKE